MSAARICNKWISKPYPAGRLIEDGKTFFTWLLTCYEIHIALTQQIAEAFEAWTKYEQSF